MNESATNNPLKKRTKKRWNNPTDLEAAIDKTRAEESSIRREAEIMDDFAKILAQKFPGWAGGKHTVSFREYQEHAIKFRERAKRLSARSDGYSKTLAALNTSTLPGIVPDSSVVTQ